MKNSIERRKKRKLRGKIIKGDLQKPRVVLSKSNRYLIAQVINDKKGHTLFYFSTANLNKSNSNVSRCQKNKEWAEKLGKIVAEKLKKKETIKIVFDRNGYPYCGKIKIFCETLRKGGIEF